MIGEVLRIIRIANDKKIKDISKESNISVSYLTELENLKRTNPSICILEKICSVYNLSLSDLFELDEYHESIVGLKEELKIYQLLLKKVLQLYSVKEKKLICEYNKKI